jgi:hypothetical protein
VQQRQQQAQLQAQAQTQQAQGQLAQQTQMMQQQQLQQQQQQQSQQHKEPVLQLQDRGPSPPPNDKQLAPTDRVEQQQQLGAPSPLVRRIRHGTRSHHSYQLYGMVCRVAIRFAKRLRCRRRRSSGGCRCKLMRSGGGCVQTNQPT